MVVNWAQPLSMTRDRDRNKERQIARAQREKYKDVAAPPKQEEPSPMFGVVRKPNNNVQIALGTFESFARNGATAIGGHMKTEQHPQQQQPVTTTTTSAPTSNSHNPAEPPYLQSMPQPHPASIGAGGAKPTMWSSSRQNHRSSSSSSSSSSQMQQGGTVGSTNRPSRAPHVSRSHHSTPSEGTKHSAAARVPAVPGPGPGSEATSTTSSSYLSQVDSSSSSSCKAAHRLSRDPQVSEIMEEINDVKEPLSALIQTPRPDHHSAFVFPNTPVKEEPLPPPPPPPHSRAPHRLHHQPSSLSKSKSSRNGDSKSKISRQIGGSLALNDRPDGRVPFKEDMSRLPDSSLANGCLSSSGIPFNVSSTSHGAAMMSGASDSFKPPLSPLKSSEESSEEETSGSESEEESSSDEEGGGALKKAPASPPPASPPASAPCDVTHTSTWDLDTLFQPIKGNKDESPSQEVGKHSEAIRESSEHGHFPHNNHDLMSSMVASNRSRRSSGIKQLPSHGPNLSEDSDSSEPSPPPPTNRPKKSHKSLSAATNQHRREKQPRRMMVETDSEDEEVLALRKAKANSQRNREPAAHKRTPNKTKAVALTLLDKQSKKKLEEKRAKNLKQEKLLNSKMGAIHTLSEDSDSSIDVLNSSPEKVKKPSKRMSGNLSVNSLHNHKSNGFLSPPPASANSYASSLPSKKNHRGPTISASPIQNISSRANSLRVEDEKPGSKERSPATSKLLEVPPNEYPRETYSRKEKRASRTQSSGHRSKRRDNSKSVVTPPISEPDYVNGTHEPHIVNPASTLSHQTCSSSSLKKTVNVNSTVPQNNVTYVNGVPKILCSIPLKLIDHLPPMNGAPLGNKKLNEEVLEMRTRDLEHKIKKERSLEPESLNEDKKKAISNIYNRKRQSSLEPDRIKREKVETNDHSEEYPKVNTKTEMKEESSRKVSSPVPSTNTSSPSPLIGSSAGTRSKHKKDKREKQKHSQNVSKPQKVSLKKSPTVADSAPPSTMAPQPLPPPALPLQHCPDTKVPKKRQRNRDASQESTRIGTKSSSQPLKKLKLSSGSEEKTCSSDSASMDDSGMSPPSTSESAVATVSHSSGDNRLAPPVAAALSSKSRPSSQPSSQYSHKAFGHKSPVEFHESEVTSSSLLNKQNHHPTPYMEIAKEEGGPQVGRPSGKMSEPYPSRDSPEREPRRGSASSPYQSERTYLDTFPHPARPASCSALQIPDHHHLDLVPAAAVEAPPISMVNYNESSVAAVSVYLSNFEKPSPEISQDFSQYTKLGKEQKYKADRENNKFLKIMMYLEAVTYFILSGVSLVLKNNIESAYKMFSDTERLVGHVYQNIILKADFPDEPHTLRLLWKLKAISLRCQSLLLLKLYLIKSQEVQESQKSLCGYYKNYSSSRQTHSSTPPTSSNVGGTTPNGNSSWPGGSQRCPSNNSPSLSPTPSPANSVGSDMSQSSGYTTSSPPRVVHSVNVPVDVHTQMSSHFQYTYRLTKAVECWMEADSSILQRGITGFFINLDHIKGPLTMLSSLEELAFYTRMALDELRKEL